MESRGTQVASSAYLCSNVTIDIHRYTPDTQKGKRDALKDVPRQINLLLF